MTRSATDAPGELFSCGSPGHPIQRMDRLETFPHTCGRSIAATTQKTEVCALTNATFPSIWAWMRAGTFPRARVVGGRSMWLSTEVDAWLAALPVRPLKGDNRPLDAA